MITGVYQSIIKHLKSCTVETASGVYVDGEFVETLTESIVDLAPFPVTWKDLKFMTDGAYTTQDKKFYELGSPSLAVHDVVILGVDRFKIMQSTDRNDDGGFSIYLGKREAKA